jgi:predicted nucleic acid-binding protein
VKLVVDANILFAALIKEGVTAELLLSDKLQLFAPEFLFKEFSKYEQLILKKTHRSNVEFNQLLELLKSQITTISKNIITPHFKEAVKFSPDPKDTVYLALALAINSNIWSNDKELKEKQNKIRIFTTKELLDEIDLIQ